MGGILASMRQKRKEKRNPRPVCPALHKGERDTKTINSISRTKHKQTIQSTGKPKRDRPPGARQKHSLIQAITTVTSTYPLRNNLTPLESRLNRSNPPEMREGIPLLMGRNPGARSPNPKISTKTFPPTTHNSIQI